MGAQTWGQTGEVGFSARGYGDPVCAFLSPSLSFSLSLSSANGFKVPLHNLWYVLLRV